MYLDLGSLMFTDFNVLTLACEQRTKERGLISMTRCEEGWIDEDE